MNVFADTSGFFALIASNDVMHSAAKKHFEYFAHNHVQLITTSFVLVETAALLQRRIGLPAVNDFNARIFPLLNVIWVDGGWYNRGVQRLVVQNQRKLSLVDCLSFEVMEANDMAQAFAFDKNFEENGFNTSF